MSWIKFLCKRLEHDENMVGIFVNQIVLNWVYKGDIGLK